MFPPVSFALEVVQECASSQAVLLGLRGSPSFHGKAVLALKQTDGYGRRGRSWWSGEGNFALSLGLELPPKTEALPLVPFVAGLAAYGAASQFLPTPELLRLKWPNDLYLDGKKLGGLIAQARQVPGERVEVVVGVGANLAVAPQGLGQETTALASFTKPPSPETFARAFLAELAHALTNLNFRELRESWEKAARLMESPLYVQGENQPVRPLELLPTGELLVENGDGTQRKLASEEVSIRFLPTAAQVP